MKVPVTGSKGAKSAGVDPGAHVADVDRPPSSVDASHIRVAAEAASMDVFVILFKVGSVMVMTRVTFSPVSAAAGAAATEVAPLRMISSKVSWDPAPPPREATAKVSASGHTVSRREDALLATHTPLTVAVILNVPAARGCACTADTRTVVASGSSPPRSSLRKPSHDAFTAIPEPEVALPVEGSTMVKFKGASLTSVSFTLNSGAGMPSALVSSPPTVAARNVTLEYSALWVSKDDTRLPPAKDALVPFRAQMMALGGGGHTAETGRRSVPFVQPSVEIAPISKRPAEGTTSCAADTLTVVALGSRPISCAELRPRRLALTRTDIPLAAGSDGVSGMTTGTR